MQSVICLVIHVVLCSNEHGQFNAGCLPGHFDGGQVILSSDRDGQSR